MTDASEQKLADNLPAIASIPAEVASLGEIIQLPEDIIEITLTGAQPATERHQLAGLVPLRNPDPRIQVGRFGMFVSEPPYSKIDEAGAFNTAGDITFSGGGMAGRTLGPRTLWAKTEELLQPKIEAQKAHKKARDLIAQEDELGQGVLLVANEFGGIDIDDPMQTAQHFILRTIIASEAKLSTVKDLSLAGLLHPMLGELMADDVIKLMDDIGKLLESVALLPESARKVAGPALLQGAVEQGVAFVEKHTEEIRLAVQIAKNPSTAQKILGLASASYDNLESYSSSSYLNKKLARHIFKLI